MWIFSKVKVKYNPMQYLTKTMQYSTLNSPPNFGLKRLWSQINVLLKLRSPINWHQHMLPKPILLLMPFGILATRDF